MNALKLADPGAMLAVMAEARTRPLVAWIGTVWLARGATPPITLTFSVAADGSLESAQALPAGRWLVHAVLRSGGETVKLSTDVQ